jgi:hypothetical protein
VSLRFVSLSGSGTSQVAHWCVADTQVQASSISAKPLLLFMAVPL